MTELKGRKVHQFRCHIDPSIGAMPKNAFTNGKDGIADIEIVPMGVYVKYFGGAAGTQKTLFEHIVPYANVQSIKLMPEEKKAAEVKLLKN
jgi:hypothetical protein